MGSLSKLAREGSASWLRRNKTAVFTTTLSRCIERADVVTILVHSFVDLENNPPDPVKNQDGAKG